MWCPMSSWWGFVLGFMVFRAEKLDLICHQGSKLRLWRSPPGFSVLKKRDKERKEEKKKHAMVRKENADQTTLYCHTGYTQFTLENIHIA